MKKWWRWLWERSQKEPKTWVVSIGKSCQAYVIIFAWCLLQWRFVNFCLASAKFGDITRVSSCTKGFFFFRFFMCAGESMALSSKPQFLCALPRCDSKPTVEELWLTAPPLQFPVRSRQSWLIYICCLLLVVSSHSGFGPNFGSMWRHFNWSLMYVTWKVHTCHLYRLLNINSAF